MRLPSRRKAGQHNDRSRGQSLTEFALFLPVLLLLVLAALDFGRIYLGWINLQQMTRVAASFAASNALDWPADQTRYEQMLENESTLINCDPDKTTWLPQYGPDISLGQQVTVKIDCDFTLVTPIISQILGTTVTASASTTYPIDDGIVGNIPGGGGPGTPAPTADFTGAPVGGFGPLQVTFTDTSTGAPATWAWNFNDGTPTGTNPSASPLGTSGPGPHVVTYGCGGAPGESCVFSVSLTVSNSGGSDSHTETGYITVTVPPATGPLADFTGNPVTGTEPLVVNFTGTATQGTPATWAWDFGDGTPVVSGTNASPAHTYNDPGDFTVTLTVTDPTGSNATIKTNYIHVERRICTVPDFQTKWRFPRGSDPGADALWAAANFTTTVLPNPDTQGGTGSSNNYKVKTQTITGGTIDPPGGCDATITVGP